MLCFGILCQILIEYRSYIALTYNIYKRVIIVWSFNTLIKPNFQYSHRAGLIVINNEA